MRKVSCKIGTIPMVVSLRYNYKIEISKIISVRDIETGSQYYQIRVTKVNQDGYFFAEMI